MERFWDNDPASLFLASSFLYVLSTSPMAKYKAYPFKRGGMAEVGRAAMADERRAAVVAWMREDGAYPYSGCRCHLRRLAGTISIDEYDEQRSPAKRIAGEGGERERGVCNCGPANSS